jgi:hypothetical protein
MNERDPTSDTLDYAFPRGDTIPRPVRNSGNGGRLVACAVLTLAGFGLAGCALLVQTQLELAHIFTDSDDWIFWSGMIVAGIGVIGFVIEYARGWRSSD